jgi:hypothetical protein
MGVREGRKGGRAAMDEDEREEDFRFKKTGWAFCGKVFATHFVFVPV